MDNLNNLVTSIIMGYGRKRTYVRVRKSRFIINILWCLYDYGWIAGFFVLEKDIQIYLKYKNSKPLFKKLKRVSKPSKKYYIKKNTNYTIKYGFGSVVTTSDGVLFLKRGDTLMKGGELLFHIL